MDRDLPSVADILSSAELIVSWTQNVTYEEFAGNDMLQSTVMYEIEIIGEATRRISSAFKERHPAIPWAKMKGMRNVLIHDYDQVIPEQVWKTCTADIPVLVKLIKPLVPKP